MSDMTDMFGSIVNIMGNLLDSDLVNRFMMAIFAVILVFGILNCILGYRLLRFWMMVGGFLVGGGLALIIVRTMGTQEKSMMMIAALVTFILAAGIGWALSIYFLHPTSSASFFACILIGVALGSMAVKYCREVLIVSTSLIGGVMAGVSLAKLGDLADFPYGLGMSVGFAIIGMLIQFAINKPASDNEEDLDDEEDSEQERSENQDRKQERSQRQEQRQNYRQGQK